MIATETDMQLDYDSHQTYMEGWRAGLDEGRTLAAQFRYPDDPDRYRDLWEENMPRVSGCMYFAIPGEQPIHVSDEEALHILSYLSTERYGQ